MSNVYRVYCVIVRILIAAKELLNYLLICGVFGSEKGVRCSGITLHNVLKQSEQQIGNDVNGNGRGLDSGNFPSFGRKG